MRLAEEYIEVVGGKITDFDLYVKRINEKINHHGNDKKRHEFHYVARVS